ncbi:hydrogenase maturation nickel metallochaperone HypA [Thiotrichales bacterium 19S3-7]|nr:hydrogenase maturation nickel metallochaperone HypA [Thiotrichales bacterium 19S3-7]MCF6802067.1 hydrogenase maturation nickel metallochaperone HypA [Thiotrichales bacterium 19S3-11]
MMHEFSICQSIIQIVSNQLETESPKVEKIILTIGQLAAIDTESLKFWFPVAARNTKVDSAELDISISKGRAKCQTCKQKFDLEKLYQACTFCHSYDREVLSGMEMLVNKIQLQH